MDKRCSDCRAFAIAGFEHCFKHLTDPEVRSVLALPSSSDVRQSYYRYGNEQKRRAAERPTNPSSPGPVDPHAKLREMQASPLARPKSPTLVCPHCGERGTVTSESVRVKKGVSGGKLTGAILTGGISMLGTGLSRKETVTQRRCSNCGSNWQI